jgi:hypothetical protein
MANDWLFLAWLAGALQSWLADSLQELGVSAGVLSTVHRLKCCYVHVWLILPHSKIEEGGGSAK